jgi:hypothetical protein
VAAGFTSLLAAATNLATGTDCFVDHTTTGDDCDGDPTYWPH